MEDCGIIMINLSSTELCKLHQVTTYTSGSQNVEIENMLKNMNTLSLPVFKGGMILRKTKQPYASVAGILETLGETFQKDVIC